MKKLMTIFVVLFFTSCSSEDTPVSDAEKFAYCACDAVESKVEEKKRNCTKMIFEHEKKYKYNEDDTKAYKKAMTKVLDDCGIGAALDWPLK
tara:strand:- start:5989 stop:6264 length:276 start_codon:yes stop_codon:yes gene_type:complete